MKDQASRVAPRQQQKGVPTPRLVVKPETMRLLLQITLAHRQDVLSWQLVSAAASVPSLLSREAYMFIRQRLVGIVILATSSVHFRSDHRDETALIRILP